MLQKINNKVTQIKSISLYSESFGNPKDTACLLIAGAGASARFWSDEFCEHISQNGYFVIRYDHRDIGLSSAINYNNHPYTVFDLADDAKDILKSYGIKQAHVVGHSMGGIIVQILATHSPEVIKSFVSISVGINTNAIQPSKEVMDILMQNKPVGDFNTDLTGFMKSWAILNGNVPMDQKLATEYTNDLYTRTIHKVDVAWNHINSQKNIAMLIDKLPQNRIPGLFIHGDADPLIARDDSIKNAEMTGNSRFEVVPGMGHMVFNRAIQDRIALLVLKHLQMSDDT